MNVSLPPRLVKDRKRREMRLRCPAHLAFVRSHACCVPNCNLHDIHGFTTEAAHVRTGTDGGTGLKPGDNWTISLCRSEEHTSELQSLMRISYAVFCLKKKN